MNPLAWLGALAVGLSLGLTGAGGSIITLPVLVYLAGLAPADAVPLSLLVVGSAALAGAIPRWRAGQIHPKAALTFALSGMLAAPLGARVTHLVPPSVLMILFAILMLGIALRMLLARDEKTEPLPECHFIRCLAAGGGVGLLTGFLGVGGGILLLPALMKFARLPLGTATGTSLLIIALNSLSGFLAHLGTSRPDAHMALIFITLSVIGAIAGQRLSSRLPAKRIRQGFAVMVLLTGLFVLGESLI